MMLGFHYMDYYHNAYAMNEYLASRGYAVLSVNYRLGVMYGRAFREPPNTSGAAPLNIKTSSRQGATCKRCRKSMATRSACGADPTEAFSPPWAWRKILISSKPESISMASMTGASS